MTVPPHIFAKFKERGCQFVLLNEQQDWKYLDHIHPHFHILAVTRLRTEIISTPTIRQSSRPEIARMKR